MLNLNRLGIVSGGWNMKAKGIVLALVLMTSGVQMASSAAAATLAGSEGDVRLRPSFGSGDACKKAWNQYVAAAGHSAYATTPYNRMTEAIFCGAAVNAGSQATAEEK